MFSHLIFLILAVLTITFASALPPSPWITSMWFSAGWGALLYAGTILLIYWQGKWHTYAKGLVYTIVQLELLIFLALFLMGLGGNTLFTQILSFNAICSLLLYFAGLAVFHYSWAEKEGEKNPGLNSIQQIRFIFPFILPFVLFLGIVDLLGHIPAIAPDSSWIWLMELALLAATLLFLPPVLVAIWQCEPMQDSALKTRLEALCAKARFKHGGILDWTILNRSHTAAILGTLPAFRYILFTKKLQEELSPEAIEAVLAHEIGHSQRRDLLFYPFIFLGVVVLTTLYTNVLSPFVEQWFAESPLFPFAVFFPYALILWFYFRVVFGFFSRLFERQADLHCFELNIPADHMITALDDVARATGFTHSAPNWHHYSIAERINFLENAKQNPKLIVKHHRYVNVALLVYTAIMVFGVYLMEKI